MTNNVVSKTFHSACPRPTPDSDISESNHDGNDYLADEEMADQSASGKTIRIAGFSSDLIDDNAGDDSIREKNGINWDSTTSKLSHQVSDLTRSAGVRTAMSKKTLGTTTTTSSRMKASFEISSFQNAPSYSALSRFAWSLITIQLLVSAFGIVVSYHTGIGAIGGVVSGMIGLFFVQLSWVVTVPSGCSKWPFVIGLIILPFAKSGGFLVEPAPGGDSLEDGINWKEFLKRMAILSTMWSCPMYFAASTTGKVLRRDCGDVGIDALGSDTGLTIREKVMVCSANYLILFPGILFYTFNAVGAFIEAGEYSDFACDGSSAEIQERTEFECETRKQFYFDFSRLALSNIFQGLVLVFAIITLATLRSSRFDLGEMVRFRLSFAECMTFGILVSFFIVTVYCGSPLYDPTSETAQEIAYWSVFVLPAMLMMALGKISYDVLHDKCVMKSVRENLVDQEELEENPQIFLRESIFATNNFAASIRSSASSRRFGKEANFVSIDEKEKEELSSRIDTLEALIKEMRKELGTKKMK